MKNLHKKLAIAFSVLSFLVFSSALAAPTANIFRTILPEANNTYNIGSSALRWANIYANNVDTTTLTIGGASSFTQGSVIFVGAAGVLAQDNTNFFWDNTNKRLGIGTASPQTSLDLDNGGTTNLRITAGGMFQFHNSSNGLYGDVTVLQLKSQGNIAQNIVGLHTLFGGLTTDGTGVLQLPAATTSAGGITFGTDTFLYRDSAGALTLFPSSGSSRLSLDILKDVGGAITFNINGVNTLFLNSAGTVTILGNAQSRTAYTTTGAQLSVLARSITDTSSSGTVATNAVNAFGIPTLLTSSATTYTNSATVYIAGAPVASTNVTQTNPLALYVAGGASAFGGNLLLGGLTTNGTGALQFATATTSAGGITFGTDVNLYRTATGRLQLDSTATDGNFTINGSGASAYFYIQQAASNRFYLGYDTTNVDIVSTGSRPLRLLTNSTLALTLDTSQNATFAGQVKTTYNGGPQFYGSRATNTGDSRINLEITGGALADHIELGYFGSSGALGVTTGVGALFTSGAHSLIFGTNSTLALTLDTSQNATFAGVNIFSSGSATGGNTQRWIGSNGGNGMRINVPSGNVVDFGVNGATAALSVSSTSVSTTVPINSSSAQTTYNGSVSGTAIWSMPFQGASYKKFIIYYNALHDAGGTISFPTAFTKTPTIYGDSAATGISTASTTTFTIALTALTSGFAIVEGY